MIDTLKKPVRSVRNIYKTYLTVQGGKKSILPSRFYVPQYYLLRMRRKMNVAHPKEFSEKLNWMKIYYHDPLFTLCADKYRMREYVKMRLGKDYTPRLLGKWDRAEDIDFDSLPNRFVIKTNHDGGPIICYNKATFDFEQTRNLLATKMNQEVYRYGREWGYKNIKRCIFAEELLENAKEELVDYKFMCFAGQPKFIQIQSEHKDPKKEFAIDYYSLDFCHLPIKHNEHERARNEPPKPLNLEQMIEVSQILSSYGEGIPFVRVDLYSVGEKIYVGEMTFYPTNGMVNYDPPEWNRIVGDWFVLPRKNGWKYQKGRDNLWIRSVLMS